MNHFKYVEYSNGLNEANGHSKIHIIKASNLNNAKKCHVTFIKYICGSVTLKDGIIALLGTRTTGKQMNVIRFKMFPDV